MTDFQSFRSGTAINMGKNLGAEKVICRFKWDYPIINLASGHIRNCCRTPKQVITQSDLDKYGTDAIMNLPYEQERRLEKLLGFVHEDCASCLYLEGSGVPSPRTGLQSWIRDYWSRNNLGISSEDGDLVTFKGIASRTGLDLPLKSQHPDMLEIVLGNTCNQKCTYCSAHYSSLWAQELVKYGEMTPAQYRQQYPEAPTGLSKIFWEWFYDVARHSVRSINILGGEPTYIPAFYDVLEKLNQAYEDLDKKQHRVLLGIITNLNCSPELLNRLISFFPRLVRHFLVSVEPSVEATYGRAEYIRYGLKWATLEANVRRLIKEVHRLGLSQHEFTMRFQVTTNVLSVSSLPEFVMWVNELNHELNFKFGLNENVVSFPRHHSPLILTPDFASFFDETVRYVKLVEEENDQFANLHNTGSWRGFRKRVLVGLAETLKEDIRSDYILESRAQFYEFIKKNDERRGCSFHATFPELRSFFDLCESEYRTRRNLS